LIKPPGSGDREPLRLSRQLRKLSAGLKSDEPLKDEDAGEERARGRRVNRDMRQRESG
jgi:hypothetical protein